MRSSFAALTVRNFAILWTGSIATFTAFFMSTIVQAIVAFELTGRNSSVGIVLLAQGIAMAILGPFGGAVADRASKRLIAFASAMVITVVFLVIGLLLAADTIKIIHLAAGAFFIGTMFAFMGPARQAWVVELVDEDELANAVALNQVALNASRVWAPAIAAGLIAVPFLGAAGAYFVMASLYGVAALSLLALPPTSPVAAADRRSVLREMVAGFQYVRGRPRLRWMLILFFAMIVLGLSSTAVLPGLLEHQLNEDVSKFGTLQAVNAVGGLLASLAVAGIAGSSRALPVYIAGALLTGVALVLTGLSPNLLVLFVPMFLMGLGMGGFQTLNSAVIVLESDPAYYGRVISLTSLAFAGFMLAGYPVGLAADAYGERVTLVVLGVMTVVIALILWPVIARTKSNLTSEKSEAEVGTAAAGGG